MREVTEKLIIAEINIVQFSYPNIRVFNNSLGRGQQESSRFYLDSNGKF
jgi:hypothetical protein